MQRDYAFVDQLAALRPQLTGLGNLERFNYWLDQFRGLRSIGQVRCLWARFDAALAKAKAEKNPQAQKKLARDLVLPVRRELVAAFTELHRYVLATVTNPGEMGNVCNWQQQTLPILLTKPAKSWPNCLARTCRPMPCRPSTMWVSPGCLSARFARPLFPASLSG